MTAYLTIMDDDGQFTEFWIPSENIEEVKAYLYTKNGISAQDTDETEEQVAASVEEIQKELEGDPWAVDEERPVSRWDERLEVNMLK